MRRLVSIFLILIIFLIFILPDLSVGDIYDEQLNRGILNLEYYVYSILEKNKQNGYKDFPIKDLLKYAPDMPALYFELSKQRFDFTPLGILESFDYLIKGISKYKDNFWWLFSILSATSLSFILSFILAIIVVVLLTFSKSLPLISHDINEDKKRIMIFLIFLLSFLGVFYFIGCCLLIVSLYLKHRERFILYIYLIFLLISPIVFYISSFVVNLPLSPKLKAIVEVNEAKGNAYALSTLKSGRDYVERFSYALALKREGMYDEAIDVYKDLLKEKEDFIIYNNLANCYVGMNDLRKALEFYQSAINIQPNATTFYNMSQVYREMLDFEKADNYFSLSSKKDFNKIIRYRSISNNNPNRFVIDIGLPTQTIFKYAVLNTSYRNLDTSVLPLYYYPIAAIIILALYLYLMQRLKVNAYSCKRCGSVFCKKCEKRLFWGDMCLQCYRSLIKLDELEPKERISRLLKIYEYRSKKRNIIKILNMLVPGTGHVYAGSILQGLLFLWPLFFFTTLIILNCFCSFGINGYTHYWLNIICLLLIAFTYIITNLITKRRLTRGWV